MPGPRKPKVYTDILSPRRGLAQNKRKDVSRRIARIHGHVHAIRKMLDEGRPYSEVVHQISAVRAALDSVTQVIVGDLAQDFVTRTQQKEPVEEALLEFQAVIASI
jgi:DNA-binding FrmR family transcriptional regulator